MGACAARRLVLAAIAVVGLLALGGPTGAGAAEPRLYTLTDLRLLNAGGLRSTLDGASCPDTAKATPLALEKALKSARHLAATGGGRKPAARLAKSKDGKTAWAATAAAGGALTAGEPHAALLALLRAQSLEPGKRQHLDNLAGVLNMLGQPRLALSMSAAAAKLSGRRTTPMGISTTATALNNRGQALLDLGHFAQAETLLRKAVGLAPLLSEAKINLAVALRCKGVSKEAPRLFRAGQYRKRYDMVILQPPPFTIEIPRPQTVLDMRGGKQARLPHLHLPGIWQKAAESGDAWQAMQNEQQARAQQASTRISQLRAKLYSGKAPRATVRRYEQIRSAQSYGMVLQPGLKQLNNQWQAAHQNVLLSVLGHGPELADARDDCGSDEACYQSRCTAINADYHGRWLGAMDAFQNAGAAQLRSSYRYGSALAANISHPVAHALLQEYLNLAPTGVEFIYLVQLGNSWAQRLESSDCSGATAPDPIQTSDGEAGAPSPCAPFLRGVKFSVKLGSLFKISTNCEQLSGELAPSAWIGPYGEASYNFVQGKGTVVVGVKEQFKIPETEVGVSAKEGLYLSVDRSGIVDAGLKVETKGSFGLKLGHSVDIKGPGFTVSFVSQTITYE